MLPMLRVVGPLTMTTLRGALRVWFMLRHIGILSTLANMLGVNAVFISTNKLILQNSSRSFRQCSDPITKTPSVSEVVIII